mgnify:CR=1 FL=1
MENNKITIYLGFPGIGKTYFCKHNPGWFDFDLESFMESNGTIPQGSSIKIIEKMIINYTKYGYKIFMSASATLFPIFASKKFNFILILPEDTKEMREDIIKRVTKRYSESDNFNELLEKIYDNIYIPIKNMAEYFNFKIVYLKPGEYLQDIIDNLSC